MENMKPTIDIKDLQIKINEYAQKGAIETIKNFYTGYDSPYKKAIEEQMNSKSLDRSFTLPDIVSTINEAISIEMDKIANTAVAKTFVPLVTNILTRADKEVKLSDVLRRFVELMDFDHEEEYFDEYEVEMYDPYENEGSCLTGSFYHIKIENSKHKYDLHLHVENKRDTDKTEDVYTVIGLPRDENNEIRYDTNRKMKLSLDGGVTLEMPFTTGILHDPFVSYIAGLVLANTKITFDVKGFDEDMFPARDHCHC